MYVECKNHTNDIFVLHSFKLLVSPSNLLTSLHSGIMHNSEAYQLKLENIKLKRKVELLTTSNKKLKGRTEFLEERIKDNIRRGWIYLPLFIK